MTIDLARQMASALDVRSESKIRLIDQALSAYARLTPQAPTTPITGAIAASQVNSGTFADARIAESNVTQHEAALSIDAGTQLVNTLADARVAESNVTQHEAALSILESQITDLGAYIEPITGLFTPSDASGAGLTLTNPLGRYIRLGTLTLAFFRVQYPATADGSNNQLDGLPVSVPADLAIRAGVISFNGIGSAAHTFPLNSTNDWAIYTTSGVRFTNAQLSTATIYGLLAYLTAVPT